MICKECKHYKQTFPEPTSYREGTCDFLLSFLEFEYQESRYEGTTYLTAISVPEDFCCNKFIPIDKQS